LASHGHFAVIRKKAKKDAKMLGEVDRSQP
jgi:hypothetical protein